MKRKYEFTGETKEFEGVKVRRIRRLSDGLIGGWIEEEDNLSHEGFCFVYDNAVVCKAASVCDYAIVCNHAVVSSQSMIRDFAGIHDHVRVENGALVKDRAIISNRATVSDDVVVGAATWLSGNTLITNHTDIRRTVQTIHEVFNGKWERGVPTSFQGSKHPMTHVAPHLLRIGCKVKTIQHWLQNFQTIGETEDYTPAEIKEYHEYIKFYAKVDARIFPKE